MFHSEVVENIVRLVRELMQHEQTDADRAACFMIAVVSVNSKQEALQTQALQILEKILRVRPQEIESVDDNFFAGLVSLMASKDHAIYSPALTIVSQCFSLDEPRLIDTGLGAGVLDHYHSLLCSSDTALIANALWGLSNITASTQAHVSTFFSHDSLLNQVLTLMSHPHERIRGEALWVICNAVNSAETNHLKSVFEEKRGGLVEPMTDALARHHDADVTLATLQALIVLLNLDLQFGQSLGECDSVCFTIEAGGGFGKIEAVVDHENRDVSLKASEVLQRCHEQSAASARGFKEGAAEGARDPPQIGENYFLI